MYLNLEKSFVGLKHGSTWGTNNVVSNEGDAVAVLIVAPCMSSLLIPSTTLIDKSVPTDQKAVADVVPTLFKKTLE